jgi:hypothetical protein
VPQQPLHKAAAELKLVRLYLLFHLSNPLLFFFPKLIDRDGGFTAVSFFARPPATWKAHRRGAMMTMMVARTRLT